MTILAAVDGADRIDPVVEVGHDLASAYDDDLVVLHVMDEEDFERMRGGRRNRGGTPFVVGGEPSNLTYRSGEASDYTLEDAMEDAASIAREVVDGTLGGSRGRRVTTKGEVGEPAEEIIREADREGARYVVVGGRRRSPVGKALFGSVSQSVILNADQPIVFAKGAQDEDEDE